MTQRPQMNITNPEAYQAMGQLEKYVAASGLEPRLLELIKIRASQINGCAFCLDMHTKDARKLGETEQRIYTLPAWRETPYFTPQEQAVLALTEAVTLVAETHVPDDVYNEAARHFEPAELGNIIMAIITINAWNRIAISTRKMPQ
ncbi:carboxymuconolactone decarboxylase family protein [Paenibacillus dendritiformis]|uniref:carboxymuconolactone decarboxylase family protein n=1 Tax=Paenibacillus dendritiformis TaxID=130049 RepID=UPI00248C544A|nr:carboxymuconolactone decarboxylase family protein [Paenibacillus dendritiformis]WGU93079.1 carboxymuconolactone decarboxylase family protein [Paenibacillus dendritiformis]